MKLVYLEKDQVPNSLILGYKGRKFCAHVEDTVTFQDTNWSGGTVSTYTAVRLVDGGTGSSFGGSTAPAPWANPVEGKTIEIPPGIVIREHVRFCGKDHGLVFHVRPDNASRLLPETTEAMEKTQSVVLVYTSHLKNSYGGRSDIRFSEARDDTGISREAWEQAKAVLITTGHLRANGSVTPKGRNAAGDMRTDDFRNAFRS